MSRMIEQEVLAGNPSSLSQKQSGEKPTYDYGNLHNEFPERLGMIEDLAEFSVKLNDEKLSALSEKKIRELAGEDGFLNRFFSPYNIRYSEIIQDGNKLSSELGFSSLWEEVSSMISDCKVPYCPIIALSGGPDSALVCRLCIEGYLNRPEEEKTEYDCITIITFKYDMFNEGDVTRATRYASWLEENFGERVPLRIFTLSYPAREIKGFISTIMEGFPLIHGKIQNMTEALTNTFITLPSEETGYICSCDTVNQTEAFLDEITNGTTGFTNLSMLSTFPKTLVLGMVEYFGIKKFVSEENSTTWEPKVASYLPDAEASDSKRVFHAIDLVTYLAVVENMSIDGITEKTGLKKRFVSNVIGRMINFARRTHLNGQDFDGSYEKLKKDMSYFTQFFPANQKEEIRKVYGIDSQRG